MATVEAATATVVAATVTVVAANYPNGSHSRSNRCQGCMQSIRGQGHLRREAVGVSHVSSTVGPRDDGLSLFDVDALVWATSVQAALVCAAEQPEATEACNSPSSHQPSEAMKHELVHCAWTGSGAQMSIVSARRAWAGVPISTRSLCPTTARSDAGAACARWSPEAAAAQRRRDTAALCCYHPRPKSFVSFPIERPRQAGRQAGITPDLRLRTRTRDVHSDEPKLWSSETSRTHTHTEELPKRGTNSLANNAPSR
jgi:hypothetical protein